MIANIQAWNAQTEYAGEYTHAGSRWAFNFFAVDDDDAAAKIESIKASLQVLGQIGGRIPFDDPA